MSNTAQIMQSESSKPPAEDSSDASTDVPTTKDANKPHTLSEQAPPTVEAGPAKNLFKANEQIPNAAQGLSEAQERDKGDSSKFWTTYDNLSKEYDDTLLSRGNGDMNIILTFAGLFSAVNSTFIIGMQPNPAETTNVLLLRLIQIAADPNVIHDISDLSSSTGYPPSTIWMQALVYASLAFSVLAAFGAVLGKQWLNAYKAARGQGSLEERCTQRQKKLDGLEHFHLQTVLQMFLVLLQISLLLFGLSLSANMWLQQRTISSVIICTTAFGILFYASTILLSRLYPDSPFQTPGSDVVRAVYEKFLAVRNHFFQDTSNTSTITPDSKLIVLSAIRWILDISTNPEFVEAVAGMVPLVQWPRDFDVSAIYARFRDNFEACLDTEEVFVKCGKAMAHLCSQSLEISEDLRHKPWRTQDHLGGKERFIREAFIAGSDACKKLMNAQLDADKQKYRADARTALRTMTVHGLTFCFSLPDDENLIWIGNLWWRGRDGLIPSCEEFGWLIDYVADEAGHKGDDETEGDALLALSALCGLGSSTKRRLFITTLIRCMGSTRPPRVRHTALRAVADARADLASITIGLMPHGVDEGLLDELSRALFTAVCPNGDQLVHDSSQSHASFHYHQEHHYLRLIFALAMNNEWHERLARDGHLARCTSLIEQAFEADLWDCRCYLAGIFTFTDPSDEILPLSPAQNSWRTCIRTSWKQAWSLVSATLIPDLVTMTRQHLRHGGRVLDDELTDLASDVHEALDFGRHIASVFQGAFSLAKYDAAISSLQVLDDDLRHMIENRDHGTCLPSLEGND